MVSPALGSLGMFGAIGLVLLGLLALSLWYLDKRQKVGVTGVYHHHKKHLCSDRDSTNCQSYRIKGCVEGFVCSGRGDCCCPEDPSCCKDNPNCHRIPRSS